MSADSEIEKLRGLLDAANSTLSALTTSNTELVSQLRASEDALLSVKGDLSRSATSISGLTAQNNSLSSQLSTLRAEYDSLRKDALSIQGTKDYNAQLLSTAQRELASVAAERDSLSKKLALPREIRIIAPPLVIHSHSLLPNEASITIPFKRIDEERLNDRTKRYWFILAWCINEGVPTDSATPWPVRYTNRYSGRFFTAVSGNSCSLYQETSPTTNQRVLGNLPVQVGSLCVELVQRDKLRLIHT